MRIQLEFPEGKVRELKALMEKAEIRTYHDLFNNALTFMKWAVQEAEEGRIIASLDERSGKVKELVMPFLQTVAAKFAAVKLEQAESAAAAHGD